MVIFILIMTWTVHVKTRATLGAAFVHPTLLTVIVIVTIVIKMVRKKKCLLIINDCATTWIVR